MKYSLIQFECIGTLWLSERHGAPQPPYTSIPIVKR
jgi:hypothetical protein